jgi:threonyl-tRNA synthetase
LAPVQVAVLPVGPDQDPSARAITDDLLAAGLRPRLDVDGSLGARVRASRERREPIIAVVGAREAAAGTVHARDVGRGLEMELARDQFVDAVRAAYLSRNGVIWPKAP